MITCKDVIIEFLMDYLSRELTPEQEALVTEHLAACPSCVRFLQSYEQTVRMGKEAAVDPAEETQVAETLVQAIMSARKAAG
jgi:anti-sigma factor RsiW